MGQDLIAGALSLALFLSPVNTSDSAALTNPHLESATPQIREVSVKNGETLSLIAERTYGDSDYWTNLWNDNPWISDPHYIEKDWKLKVRLAKTEKPEDLKSDLAKKLEATRRLAYVSETVIQHSINPQTPPAPVYSGTGPLNDAQLNYLGNCESGMRANTNTGNGFYGAFQFTIGTWNRMQTGYTRADLAPIEVQKEAVQKLVSQSNIFGQFPACSRRMQSQGIL